MSVDLFSFFKKNIFKNKIDFNQVIRFRLKEKYTKNFGFQWHKHQKTQLDSFTGIPLSKNRFYKNTKWKITDLKNKNVLELGSGAGRFTEILTKTNCNLFTVDSSNSIFVNFDSNFKKNNKKKVFFIQADIENLPFKSNMFDYVFCYGVIQHTKDPKKVLDILINNTKVGGKISIDFYKKRYLPNCWSTPKYFWRPLSTRININILYKIISWYIPYYLPFDTLLKKTFGKLGFVLTGFIPIPCWNYFFLDLDKKTKVEWAILDTFDALSPKYDKSFTNKDIEVMLKDIKARIKYKIFNGSNGLVLNITKL
jgi:ubiquinone/menaquinone biosynthesis C-methylase UbiE